MIFAAVISLFSYLFPTAHSPKFISNLRLKYGESILISIRHCEKLTEKLQKAKCDVEFLRCCLIYNLMPNFVNIRLWKPGLKKSEQYKSLQRTCLMREFECRQKQAKHLEKRVSSILIEFEKHLSSIDYVNIKKFFYNSACRVHSTVMSNHQKKLEKINRGPIGQNYEEMKLKLIHNISSYTLSKIHNASQQLIRKSKSKKRSNLSDEELAALKSLKSNNNIVICKADKGNTSVILDKETYMEKADKILKGKQFEPLNNDKFHREQEEKLNKYIFSLCKKGVIDNKLRYQLKSTCSSLSVFYGLPKAHKIGYPIRPIISTIGSYQYELSKYLAKAIRNARPQAKSYIKDSFEFVKRMKELTLEKGKPYTMCSFDVESLYTNVPVEEATEVTLNYIYKPTKLIDVPFDKEQMKTLLNLSIKDSTFRFHNKIYKQIDGVAMGNPLAPIIADLWMQKMEEKLNRFSTKKPMIWLRYVDDIFCIFTIPREKIHEFHMRINKWHRNLCFTAEFEVKNSIPFLDVRVTHVEDKLITSMYRKPTHTGLYLLWDSNQSRRYKLGLIKTLVIRIYRICSTTEIINNELDLLRETLTNNGYPPHIIKRGITEGKILVKSWSNTKQDENKNKNVIFFTIKYYGQESTIFASR
ncbi:unnamed protein product, partial [Rotaria socialis]